LQAHEFLQSFLVDERTLIGAGRVHQDVGDVLVGEILQRFDGVYLLRVFVLENLHDTRAADHFVHRHVVLIPADNVFVRLADALQQPNDERHIVVRRSQRQHFSFQFCFHLIQPLLELRIHVFDVLDQHGLQRPGQRLLAVFLVYVRVKFLQKVLLGLQRGFHRFVLDGVLLAPVHHTYDAQLDGDPVAQQQFRRVLQRPVIDDVQLGDHRDGPDPFRVQFFRYLQALARRRVRVGRHHRQNDRVRLFNVRKNQPVYLLIYVVGLVAHSHFRYAGQVVAC